MSGTAKKDKNIPLATLKKFSQKFWDELYKDFLCQELSKKEFLESRCIQTRHDFVRNKTRFWMSDLKQGARNLKYVGGKYVNIGPRKEVEQILEMVKTWKNELAAKHYKSAEIAMVHAELILANGLEVDENNNPVRSNITPTSLKALTTVISDIQKIQRTALGLPGETTGVITADVNTDKSSPDFVFNVRVNENGKFVNPRPQLEDEPNITDVESEDVDSSG